MDSIAQSVHWLPKTSVVVGRELTICGQTAKRSLLPQSVIVVDTINHLRFQNKKASVNPAAITLGLFLKAANSSVVAKLKHPKTARWLHRRDRTEAAAVLCDGR